MKIVLLKLSGKALNEFTTNHQYIEMLNDLKENYEEDILVGYRWFDTKGIEPMYPFGFGLSYTTFEYDNMRLPESLPCGESLELKIQLRNRGKRDGHEVVQVYAAGPSGLDDQPIRRLVAYTRVFVSAGSEKEILIKIDAHDLATVDSEGKILIRPGRVSLSVGGCQPDAASLKLGGAAAISADVELVGQTVDPFINPNSTGVSHARAD